VNSIRKLKKRIEESIDLNFRGDLHNIKVMVENDRVILSGQINGFTNKVYAEILAIMVAHVSFVQNEIKVKN
jgi:osmotically-inducible protein OsmY